jgi:hypothetical protein
MMMITIKLIDAMKRSVFFLGLIFFTLLLPDQFSFLTNLFPVSWYERGMHTTIMMLDDFAKRGDQVVDSNSFDVILGRCAFADFCFTRMNQERQAIITEDSRYVLAILDTLKDKISNNDSIEKERAECFFFIVDRIEKQLKTPNDI